MNELTIVTGYFDINRTQWVNYKRSNNDYLKYFKAWASIKNRIIVFVDDNQTAQEILAFRKDKGLENDTKVINVENIENIDLTLFKSIENQTSNTLQKNFRLQSSNPEVINAKYDYVMLMKEWCVHEAVTKGYADGMIAWVDFGYNHGGETIVSSNFDEFRWEYDFPEKICLFACKDIDGNRPIFDIIRNMSVYVMGTVIVAPDKLWLKLWDYVREEMYALNHCGLVDDDQTILLMVYLNHKEECEILHSSWNKMIPDYCNNKRFEFVNKEEKKISKLKQSYMKLKWSIFKIRYCLRQYKNIKELD